MDAIINGYEIVEELNKGAFCDSFKVRKGGRYYFMKLYKDPTVMSKDYSAFVKNQRAMIPLLKSLGDKTETIVEDFEIKKEGRYYQIKELIPSSTNLRKWLEANGDYDKRLDVAIQFCDVLKAVHGKNIIHQDLKPEQVMTVPDSSKKAGIRLILTDFDWSVPNGKVVRYVGTPGYNNIDGTKLSYKSDIFTFGIILCELLTGGNPFVITEKGGERVFEPTAWVHWVKKKEFVSPNRINDELPKVINDIIVQCLDPEQSKRPSLDDIANALQGKVPTAARKKAKLIAAKSGDKMILVPGTTYGRNHFKELFKNTEDSDGNLVYKYLDQTYAIIDLTQEDEQLYMSYPAYGMAKNKLLLNGKELKDTPTPLNNGDKLSVFSTSKGVEVAVFNVEVA